MFEVIISPDLQSLFDRIGQPLAKKLSRCFARLELNPRSGNNVKQLKGAFAGYYRYRVGDWRVIYRIDDQARHVFVVDIAHRSEAYE